ncbi:MAG: ABC transporter permease [Acidobacteriota bacterium]
MRAFLQDLRYAARTLRRSPGFAAVAIATLALGIGANTAIFSVVRGVLLRPLPYRDADRLVVVWEDLLREGNHPFSVDAPNFVDLKARCRSFSDAAAQMGAGQSLTGGGAAPEALYGARVTGNFFPLLGARPALGRTILPADQQDGRGRTVAVLGHGLWKRRFGASADIIGRTIQLDDVAYTVVGVMPEGFDSPAQWKAPNRAADVWTPLDLPRAWNSRGVAVLQVVARLAPGASLASANAEVAAFARSLGREYPKTNENIGLHAVPLKRQLFGNVGAALWIVSGAVGLVLLVACANIAHLLLVRASSRTREVAIRLALGATRARIISTLLAEGFLLAAAGAALAWAAVSVTTSALVAAAPAEIPRLAEVRPDGSVLVFALAIALFAGLASALLPAIRGSRIAPEPSLRGEGVASGRASGRLRAALVVSQVALALLLFSGAALLVRTFEHLRRFDIGFDAARVLTARLPLPKSLYETDQQKLAFFDQLFERLEATPGVAAAGGTTRFPLDPGYGVGSIFFEGRGAAAETAPVVGVRVVGGRYFDALRIPIRSGRDFRREDRPDSVPAAVVNASMARRFWPGESPVGKRISIGFPPETWRTVVGVSGDVSHDGIDAAPLPEVYIPLAQSPESGLNLVVRGRRGPVPPSVLSAAIASIDRNLPLIEVRPMEARVSDALSQPRFLLEAFGAFAALSLLLAALALFALVSHDAARRRREIGIRMTLGAGSGAILRLFLSRAATLVSIGVALGLAGALALGRVLAPALHGTRPTDPAALASAEGLLAAVALAAAAWPAHRATRSDPLDALRRD